MSDPPITWIGLKFGGYSGSWLMDGKLFTHVIDIAYRSRARTGVGDD